MEKKNVCELVGKVGGWFVSALFIWWGWNTIAPHLNSPLFGYWEIFAMRMALSSVMKIFHQREVKKNV